MFMDRFGKFLLAASVLFTLVPALEADAQAPQRPSIGRIVLQSGTSAPLPLDHIHAHMNSAEGNVFDQTVLDDDIKRLMATGLFADINAGFSLSPEGGPGTVTLVIWMQPSIRAVLFEGNVKTKTKRLMDLVSVKVGQRLNEQELAKDEKALRDYYHAEGLRDTEIAVKRQEIPGTDEVNIIFRIVEKGQETRIRSTSFLGNTKFSARELRKQVSSTPSFWRHLFKVGLLDEDKIEADKQALRKLYTSAGYLDFGVVNVDLDYTKNMKWVDVTFRLHEGQPYTVTDVTVAGNARFDRDRIMEQVKLSVGSVYNSAVETGDVARIRALYGPEGYLEMRCFPDHKTNGELLTVDVEYRIREGKPSRIRDVYISGNRITKDHVIRRELAVHPGDVADANKIASSRSRLMNLNYFRTVDVSPMHTEDEALRDLFVTVDEAKTGQLMLGVGYSDEADFLAWVELAQRNFDWRNWPRFTGGGQRMRLRAQLGTESDSYLIQFTEPWWLKRRLRLDLSLYRNDRDQGDYTQQTAGFNAKITRPLGKGWRQAVGIRVQNTNLNSFDAGLSPQLLDEEGSYSTNAVVMELSRNTTDRYPYPSRGSRVSVGLDLQAEALGSYSNVYKLRLKGSRYFPVFRSTVLKVEGELATVDELSGDPAAIFDRYFAGGAYSIRGFKRRSVSPVDVNEDYLGGKSLLTGTAELTWPLYDMIHAAVFCDAGNVWAGATDWDPSELNISIGCGILFRLPIGPIRLEYGYPIVTDQDHLSGASGRIHFNLGYMF